MIGESQTEVLPPEPPDDGPGSQSQPDRARRPSLLMAALVVGAVVLVALALTQHQGSSSAVPVPTPTTSRPTTSSPDGVHQVSFTNVWSSLTPLPASAPRRITVRYDPTGRIRYTFSQVDGSGATSATSTLGPDAISQPTWTRAPGAPTILVGVFPGDATWLATAPPPARPGPDIGSAQPIPGTDLQAVVRVLDTTTEVDALRGVVWSGHDGGLFTSDPAAPAVVSRVAGLPGGDVVWVAAVVKWGWFAMLDSDGGLIGSSPLGSPVKRVTYPFYPAKLRATPVTTLAGVLPPGATGASARAPGNYVTAMEVVPLGSSGRMAYVAVFTGDLSSKDITITWVDRTGTRHPLDLGDLPRGAAPTDSTPVD